MAITQLTGPHATPTLQTGGLINNTPPPDANGTAAPSPTLNLAPPPTPVSETVNGGSNGTPYVMPPQAKDNTNTLIIIGAVALALIVAAWAFWPGKK